MFKNNKLAVTMHFWFSLGIFANERNVDFCFDAEKEGKSRRM